MKIAALMDYSDHAILQMFLNRMRELLAAIVYEPVSFVPVFSSDEPLND